ncbi:hypothetical protein L0Y34_00395 [Candidatus Parcubacteria bacterium]|nr:hypothetical protein [Candidatus Parcubacteria bacterium]
MELPENLKRLYRHWRFHTTRSVGENPRTVFKSAKLFKDISWFVGERLHIWEQKTVGKEPPYTKDKVLSHYRFCNIFREFDRQTIAFHTLLNPLRDNFPLWLLNMFYCRMVANTDTVKHVGLLSFDTADNKKFYTTLLQSPRPRFGTPYVFPVSVIQRSTTPTRELFIAHHLPSIMKTVAKDIQGWNKKNIYDGVKTITPIFGFNLNFLWTEVLIDVAYQFPEFIDLFARFPVGPGSLPTMERINAKKDPTLLVEDLARIELETGLTYNKKPVRLSAENWEGIGCEFRKYTNLKAGKGRRRIFGASQS